MVESLAFVLALGACVKFLGGPMLYVGHGLLTMA